MIGREQSTPNLEGARYDPHRFATVVSLASLRAVFRQRDIHYLRAGQELAG